MYSVMAKTLKTPDAKTMANAARISRGELLTFMFILGWLLGVVKKRRKKARSICGRCGFELLRNRRDGIKPGLTKIGQAGQNIWVCLHEKLTGG